MKNTTLVWFRQDLRLADNPALTWASQQGQVVACYIADNKAPKQFVAGGASRWWLHHSLSALNHSLQGKLHCLEGNAIDELLGLVKRLDINKVVWNRLYEPWQIKRDTEIKQTLQDAGIEVHSFNGSLLWEPWQVLKKDASPYKVFTPYYRKGCLSQTAPRVPLAEPTVSLTYCAEMDIGIEHLGLMPDIRWDEQIEQQWAPGEAAALKTLEQFAQQSVDSYKENRNFPSIRGTSRLSPHLHFGELSPNQAWHAAIQAMHPNVEHPDLDCFLSELGWREFSHYLLYHFPDIPTSNFNRAFDAFKWRNDPASLLAWQQGKTGVPIVDAGMRELWQTGYMHNRVRMIVGSYLVKNLLIDWRHGERWFWDCLLDADLAANSASWQWVAGSGADAAPYFRIFNPVLQGQKFDSEGQYVKHYCPELSELPKKFIHNPWEAPESVLEQAGVELGVNYPKPLVDLKHSRQRALDAFAETKKA